ncbi:MAG: SHOCT domain-containing protein [Patescibacteria group bacterium]
MVFFWVLVISAIIWLIKALTTGGQNNNGGQPLEILKQRYARGEITKKEFEEIKKEINK